MVVCVFTNYLFFMHLQMRLNVKMGREAREEAGGWSGASLHGLPAGGLLQEEERRCFLTSQKVSRGRVPLEALWGRGAELPGRDVCIHQEVNPGVITNPVMMRAPAPCLVASGVVQLNSQHAFLGGPPLSQAVPER